MFSGEARRIPAWARVAGALIVIAAAAVWVFRLLAAGEFSSRAPAYASMGTAPDGASVLFGAYQRAGLNVIRGWDADSLGSQAPAATAAFVIAPEDWDPDLDRTLDRFVLQGGWLVLVAPPWRPQPTAPDEAAASPPPLPPLRAALGASLPAESSASSSAQPTQALPVSDRLPSGLQPLPLWRPHDALQLSAGWMPLFRRDGNVYMAARQLGAGTVILVSEPGFLSNDGLDAGADPALLAWLADGRRTVFVDESEHGLAHDRGILWLMVRYRLQAALLLLLANLALLAWSLGPGLELPPASPAAATDLESVESGMVGLVRLLQRAVPPSELVAVCWRRFALRSPAEARRLEPPPEAEASSRVVPAALVAAFNRIQAERACGSPHGRLGVAGIAAGDPPEISL